MQVTSNDMDGVAHHLLDVVDPPEGFSVLRYKYVACRLAVDGFVFFGLRQSDAPSAYAFQRDGVGEAG